MIIGMVGFAGSGKGTVADVLVEYYHFTKLSFADTLKDAVASIFSWPRHLLEGDTKESREFREKIDPWWTNKFGWDVSPRIILQNVGTEALRNHIHFDIWILSLEKRLEGYDRVVISDVRFPNEMKFIQSKNGFNIRVKRGEEPSWYDTAFYVNQNNNPLLSAPSELNNIHYSEWAWIGQPTHYVLKNDTTISALISDTQDMLSHLESVDLRLPA